MFRAMISPLLRSTRLCLQLVVQWFHRIQATGLQHRECILPQAVSTVCAPQDGRNHRPQRVEIIGIINPLALELDF